MPCRSNGYPLLLERLQAFHWAYNDLQTKKSCVIMKMIWLTTTLQCGGYQASEDCTLWWGSSPSTEYVEAGVSRTWMGSSQKLWDYYLQIGQDSAPWGYRYSFIDEIWAVQGCTKWVGWTYGSNAKVIQSMGGILPEIGARLGLVSFVLERRFRGRTDKLCPKRIWSCLITAPSFKSLLTQRFDLI